MHACLKRLTDPASALLVTVMTALGYSFYVNAARILSDMPMALMAWLAIYACMGLGGGDGRGWSRFPCSRGGSAVSHGRGAVHGGTGRRGLLDARLMGPWRRRLAGACAVALPALATVLILYALARQVSDAPHYESALRQTADTGKGLVASYLGRFAEAAGYWPDSMASLMTAQRFGPYGWLLIALWLAGLAAGVGRRSGSRRRCA